MKYLFLDTNIYLHCKDYEQLNWSKILSNADDITIVVPPIIQKEINAIKDRGTGKVNQRARAISKRFREIFLEDTDRSIPMILCKAPRVKDYEEYDLDREVQDDQFILSAILFQKNGNKEVIVIARDTYLLITAKSNGLKHLHLPDEYCLQTELSEEDKELLQLRKELEQYKNRLSKPRLTFENGKEFMTIKKPISKDIESDIQEAIMEEWSNVPYHNDAESSIDPLVAAASSVGSIMAAFKPKPEEIERYNREAIDYHKEFEEYIRLKFSRKELLSRIYELKFIITNEGTAPTGDLDILIEFPDTIDLYNQNSKKYFDENKPPVKPEPPSSFGMIGFSRELKMATTINPISLTRFGYVDDRPKMWDLKKSIKERRHHVSRNPLSQTLYDDIEIDDNIYVDLMQCGNFSIDYTIVDTTLPKPVTGVLNVVVE